MTLMTLMIRHIGRKECYVEGAKRELGFRTASLVEANLVAGCAL